MKVYVVIRNYTDMDDPECNFLTMLGAFNTLEKAQKAANEDYKEEENNFDEKDTIENRYHSWGYNIYTSDKWLDVKIVESEVK